MAAAGVPHAWAGGILTVDLAAIRANWRLLRDRAAGASCAAVVKADAYGLGVAPVAAALAAEGCRHFFVAHLQEGVNLRTVLGQGPMIGVLHGAPPGTEEEFGSYDLVPVLNSRGQLESWAARCRAEGRPLPAILHVDTGMSRLGLSPAEVEAVAEDGALQAIQLRYVMSHLACGEEPDNPANAAQLAAFAQHRSRLPAAPASLASSGGVFLGSDYHFDLVRPGAALYGVAPVSGQPNPMYQVVRLQARVVQTREVPAGTPVGYGHTARTASAAQLATVSVGYADGYFRSASNQGVAYFGDTPLPVVGRVSMDSIILDAGALPPGALGPDALVDLIGPRNSVDAVAKAAGTIGYEVLTNLGSRFHRRYIGA
jgi:alanine racemase